MTADEPNPRGVNRLSDAWVGAIVLVVLAGMATGAWLWTTRDSDPLIVPKQQSESEATVPAGAPAVWKRAVVNGSQLQIHYGGSACQVSNDVQVVESRSRVVVTVHAQDSRRVCTLQLVGYDIAADLSSALADRSLYDGACLAESTTPNDPSCLRHPQGA